MTILQSVIRGIIYVVAELLSASGQAHILFADTFLSYDSSTPYLVNAFARFGIIAAAVFRKRLLRPQIPNRRRKKRKNQLPQFSATRYTTLLITAAVPMAAAIPLRSVLSAAAAEPIIAAAGLFINGYVLFTSDRFRNGAKTENSLTIFDALQLGIINLFTFLPGIARPAMNYYTAAGKGLDKKTAERIAEDLSLAGLSVTAVWYMGLAMFEGMNGQILAAAFLTLILSAALAFTVMTALSRIGAFLIKQVCYYSWCLGAIFLIISLIK